MKRVTLYVLYVYETEEDVENCDACGHICEIDREKFLKAKRKFERQGKIVTVDKTTFSERELCDILFYKC